MTIYGKSILYSAVETLKKQPAAKYHEFVPKISNGTEILFQGADSKNHKLASRLPTLVMKLLDVKQHQKENTKKVEKLFSIQNTEVSSNFELKDGSKHDSTESNYKNNFELESADHDSYIITSTSKAASKIKSTDTFEGSLKNNSEDDITEKSIQEISDENEKLFQTVAISSVVYPYKEWKSTSQKPTVIPFDVKKLQTDNTINAENILSITNTEVSSILEPKDRPKEDHKHNFTERYYDETLESESDDYNSYIKSTTSKAVESQNKSTTKFESSEDKFSEGNSSEKSDQKISNVSDIFIQTVVSNARTSQAPALKQIWAIHYITDASEGALKRSSIEITEASSTLESKDTSKEDQQHHVITKYYGETIESDSDNYESDIEPPTSIAIKSENKSTPIFRRSKENLFEENTSEKSVQMISNERDIQFPEADSNIRVSRKPVLKHDSEIQYITKHSEGALKPSPIEMSDVSSIMESKDTLKQNHDHDVTEKYYDHSVETDTHDYNSYNSSSTFQAVSTRKEKESILKKLTIKPFDVKQFQTDNTIKVQNILPTKNVEVPSILEPKDSSKQALKHNLTESYYDETIELESDGYNSFNKSTVSEAVESQNKSTAKFEGSEGNQTKKSNRKISYVSDMIFQAAVSNARTSQTPVLKQIWRVRYVRDASRKSRRPPTFDSTELSSTLETKDTLKQDHGYDVENSYFPSFTSKAVESKNKPTEKIMESRANTSEENISKKAVKMFSDGVLRLIQTADFNAAKYPNRERKGKSRPSVIKPLGVKQHKTVNTKIVENSFSNQSTEAYSTSKPTDHSKQAHKFGITERHYA